MHSLPQPFLSSVLDTDDPNNSCYELHNTEQRGVMQHVFPVLQVAPGNDWTSAEIKHNRRSFVSPLPFFKSLSKWNDLTWLLHIRGWLEVNNTTTHRAAVKRSHSSCRAVSEFDVKNRDVASDARFTAGQSVTPVLLQRHDAAFPPATHYSSEPKQTDIKKQTLTGGERSVEPPV